MNDVSTSKEMSEDYKETVFIRRLTDKSFLSLEEHGEEKWYVMFLFSPDFLDVNEQINSHGSRSVWDIDGKLKHQEDIIDSVFSERTEQQRCLTMAFYNWEFVCLFSLSKDSVTKEQFKEIISKLESRAKAARTVQQTLECEFVHSAIAENVDQLPRMYFEVRKYMELTRFCGKKFAPTKDMISEQSDSGKFNAKDKKHERDFFAKLVECDFGGAVECLDRLLDMVGTGIYKDLSVFRTQVCGCVELASCILGFKAGNEHLLTDIIPQQIALLKMDGKNKTKEEFRKAVCTIIDEIKTKVIYDNRIKTATVETAVERISRRFMDPQFTVQSLANEMSVNLSYLSRVFKLETNTTVSGYIQHMRIENAKTLLRETERSIEEITGESGFFSVKTFYRAFSKAEGVSPSHYRRYNRGERTEIKR